MNPVIRLRDSFNDSLEILAFKWGTVRSKKSKVGLLIAAFFVLLLVFGTASLGTAVQNIISPSGYNPGAADARITIIAALNIFLQNNANLAVAGVLWAIIGSVLIIPLIGYSFASLTPEGDLVTLRKDEKHRIADSIILQLVSTISFIQILTVTGLASILSIGADTPAVAIIGSWCVWVLAVMFTTFTAWFFEYLRRRFGFKSTLISAGILIAAVTAVVLFAFEPALQFFGLAEAIQVGLQTVGYGAIPVMMLVTAAITFGLALAVTGMATAALRQPERLKKKDTSKVLLSRLGLVEKLKISSGTQFFLSMLARQGNIVKPLLISVGFLSVIASIIFSFYQTLLTVAILIPVMVSLVWSINVFGIIGPGLSWLMTVPTMKTDILKVTSRVNYVLIGIISVIVAAVVAISVRPGWEVFASFFLAVIATAAVITQFSTERAIKQPHRYRVHIRGESTLPPDKAFIYLFQLFATGFLISGIVYGAAMAPILLGGPTDAWLGVIAQVVLTALICGAAWLRFRHVRSKWLLSSHQVLDIMKVVGAAN